jgi:hypothetical protein
VQLNELIPRARPFAPLAVIAAAVAAGFARGLGVALLVLAGGMLLLAIGFLWESVQSLGDEADLTLDEALALAAPSAEEEKKRAVLRALKDLEFERGVGKVSDEDYKKLSAQYREEAKALLQVLDREQSPARARAEKLAASFVEDAMKDLPEPKKASEKPEEPEADEADESTDDVSEPEETEVEESAADDEGEGETSTEESDEDEDEDEDETEDDGEHVCAKCETKNDADARFCKKCGEALS